MKTRSQKLKTIKGIMSGAVSISDLPQPVTSFLMLFNGIYTDLKTGLEVDPLKHSHGTEPKKEKRED